MANSLIRRSALTAAVTAASIAYPLLVYFGLRHLPDWFFGGALLALLALRWLSGGAGRRDPFAPVISAAALGSLLLFAIVPELGVKLYPVLVNAVLAAIFAASLLRPPTVIERIARLATTELSPAVSRYLRNVTAAWLGFFLVNGAISTWTVAQGSLEAWALYNGLISYLLIGAMFAGELTVRRFVLRAAAPPS
jgi:uncharacterized membrane protein